MVRTFSLMAALAASTVLAGGLALADTASAPPAGQQQNQSKVEKDFSKLSKDGSHAYQDLVLTRLAIFDGKIADAKKYIGEADTDFGKAKSDRSVFTKAEADLKAPGEAPEANGQAAGGAANGGASPDKTAKADTAGDDASKAPVKWLPVDGELTINEDYTKDKTKSTAVAEANKSLAKGDTKGAMEKLKLAAVNMDIVLAVLPLEKTMSDVHQAAGMINDGKFYEASQLLRQVQDSLRFDVAEVDSVPKAATGKSDATSGKSSSSGTPAAEPSAH